MENAGIQRLAVLGVRGESVFLGGGNLRFALYGQLALEPALVTLACARRCCWRWPFAATGRASGQTPRGAQVNAGGVWGNGRRPQQRQAVSASRRFAVGKPQHLAVALAPASVCRRSTTSNNRANGKTPAARRGCQRSSRIARRQTSRPWPARGVHRKPTLNDHTLPGGLLTRRIGQPVADAIAVGQAASRSSTSINNGAAPCSRAASWRASTAGRRAARPGGRGSGSAGSRRAAAAAQARPAGRSQPAHGQQGNQENRRMAMLLCKPTTNIQRGQKPGRCPFDFRRGGQNGPTVCQTPRRPIGERQARGDTPS